MVGVFIEESIIIANHHEWLQELLSVGSLAVIEGHCVSIKAFVRLKLLFDKVHT